MAYGDFSNRATKSSYRCYMLSGSDSREIRESASEIKFFVDRDTAGRLRERVRGLLAPDPFASGPDADQYATTTLYFDTDNYAVYNRRGSYRRAKYRVRRYGSGDLVFLERKLRTADCLSKRRTSVRIEDLPLLTSQTVDATWAGAWFHERLLMRRLGAVCQINYRRTARVGMTDYGPIRLTLDEDLCGLPIDQPDFRPIDGAVSLTPLTIVEMKFRAAMPSVFKKIVEEFSLRPGRISKYRLGIEAARPGVAASAAARRAEIAALKASNA